MPHEEMFGEQQPWLTSWFLMNDFKEGMLLICHLTEKISSSSLLVQANRDKQLKQSRSGSFSWKKRQPQSSKTGRENVLQLEF